MIGKIWFHKIIMSQWLKFVNCRLDNVYFGIYNTNVVKISYKEPAEFIWDRGNQDKNWLKHEVTNREAEEIFFDDNKRIYKDVFHSRNEKRFIILGKTKNERLLYIVFTIREKKIRIISARDINKKEVLFYEKTT